MSSIHTTISLLLIMVLGYLFQDKIKSKDQREGIRIIILSLALPATIFIALIKINFTTELIFVPALALIFNFIIYVLVSKLPVQSLLNIPANQHRSLILLIPSLAPGLSCFPFILEYSGESTVAVAALADLGNKIFVLIIAYVIAMKWYFHANKTDGMGRKVNLKDVTKSLIAEPVNMVIATALLMLALGLSYTSLPEFIRLSVDKISLLMTPLVLLFIGISIRLTGQQVRTIFSFLFFRSSIAFVVSGLILLTVPVDHIATALLIVVFPQSAVSFWPYAHMSVVNGLESSNSRKEKTFDLDFGMNVLGCSLPFSVILILLVYSSGNFFIEIGNTFLIALLFMLLAIIPAIIPAFRVGGYFGRLKSKES